MSRGDQCSRTARCKCWRQPSKSSSRRQVRARRKWASALTGQALTQCSSCSRRPHVVRGKSLLGNPPVLRAAVGCGGMGGRPGFPPPGCPSHQPKDQKDRRNPPKEAAPATMPLGGRRNRRQGRERGCQRHTLVTLEAGLLEGGKQVWGHSDPFGGSFDCPPAAVASANASRAAACCGSHARAARSQVEALSN